jgi:cyclopropane fatty-acyl-phospholipid synthase-like methyltransferase
MGSKTTKEIQAHYQQGTVADKYDQRRFEGVGGRYVNDQEIFPVTNQLKSIYGKSKKKILDIGAGRGRLTFPIFKLGHQVFCLDSSKAMTKYLSPKISSKNIIIQSAFEKFPASVVVDCITSLRFFDHFNLLDQEKLIKNAIKNLSYGGHFIYTGLNSNSIEYLLSSLFSYGRYNYYYPDGQYQRMFQNLGMRVLSKNSNFIIPRGVFLYTQKIPWLCNFLINCDRFSQRIMPNFGAYVTYDLMKQE